MIKNLRKKGFTIVELVIVIAVIAILAAILIPTFSGIIKKANIASDTALAKNMNTALVMAESDGVEVEDVSDVLVIINEAGYIIENLNPTTQGYYFAWDSESIQVLFLDDKLEIHYQSKTEVGSRVNWWTTVDSAAEAMFIGNEGISIYFENEIEEDITLTNLVSVDTGFYTHSGILTISDTAALTTVLRGQFNEVEINAPAATIAQYGSIVTANIIAIAETSFDVHGRVTTLGLTKGHVNNKGGSISNLTVAADTKVTNGGLIKTLASVSGTVTITFVNNGILNAVSKTSETPTVNTGSSGDGTISATENASATLSISNATELQNFAYAVNNGADYSKFVVEITKDIDLKNRAWTPIGNSKDNPFIGATIEGNNHKISGLTNTGYVGGSSFQSASKTAVNPYGLFGWVTGSTTISNLDLNVSITSTNKAGFGAFIGCAKENDDFTETAAAVDLTFINCTSSGSLQGIDKIGGFIGTAYTSDPNIIKSLTLTNCTNNASITGVNTGTSRIGGFVGTLSTAEATFTNCTNNGKIENKASNGDHMTAAGFVGFAHNGLRTAVAHRLVFSGCSNNGSITTLNTSNGFTEVAAHNYIGMMQGCPEAGSALVGVSINGVNAVHKKSGESLLQ